MPDSVFITTLADWEWTGAEVCSLCRYRTAALRYELNGEDYDFHPLRGYCCVGCAAGLLAALDKVQRAKFRYGEVGNLGVFSSLLN